MKGRQKEDTNLTGMLMQAQNTKALVSNLMSVKSQVGHRRRQSEDVYGHLGSGLKHRQKTDRVRIDQEN